MSGNRSNTEIEKIFNNLESNQMLDSEEAKRTLIELFMQYKDQWLVNSMMDYFLKTGSLRIMEVLVKVQAPHDGYIFDRLSEWLKLPAQRVQALNLFCFVVRKHPTWLFKVEKHRMFKDIFKLLATEKDIVPLMSALLCIITLLPIMPSLVPNFLGDLFDVFGHLASWNCQNPNRLSEDKLVHLQLGLQMLFHRLYGMYPWNFLGYLSEFIKKEKSAIFHHTIKPLLATVRVHPMLVTANTDSELHSGRWKEMEPHDVVVECAKLSLPVTHQDLTAESAANSAAASCDWLDTPGALTAPSSSNSREMLAWRSQAQILKKSSRFDGGDSAIIWSPLNNINASGAIPLTPTPSYGMQPLSANSINLSNQVLSLTGSSPPEAAVEATPETTPLKDLKDYKLRHMPLSATHVTIPQAVRAILISSQPSSPMRKEQQFNFPDAILGSSGGITSATTTTFVQHVQQTTSVTNTLQSRVVQMVRDRNHSQHAVALQTNNDDADGVDEEGDGDGATAEPATAYYARHNFDVACDVNAASHIGQSCANCNETSRSMCTAGGLHIPTSKSMQLLAKGIKRRNRMTSYCYNDTSRRETETLTAVPDSAKIRRTKSCSSIVLETLRRSTDITAVTDAKATQKTANIEPWKNCERPLQKSARMLKISRHNATTSTAAANATVAATTTRSLASCLTQTVQTWPQDYESILYEMFVQNNKMRHANECNAFNPQEILDQYIMRTIKPKEAVDAASCRVDQEQLQLLCLQLQYERYRREIHAERNRRLMGRSRDKRSLEMERDRLREQLDNFAVHNDELKTQLEQTTKTNNERHELYLRSVSEWKEKYQHEMEQHTCLRQLYNNLQTRFSEELTNRKDMNYELESLRGQIFNMKTECQHAQLQAEIGLQCKQELARLEVEFVVMGEVQMKCRDRLAEIDNFRARDEEIALIQDSYNIELKDLKHVLDEKSSQLDSARHKIGELQSQLVNNEKVITEQKRSIRTVKDEYEEKFKALNRKYEVQKTIILQMEERILSLHKTHAPATVNACSPDTDRTDIASSMERNSPLSTSLASSESLSTSLRSTELRNLHQLVETPLCESGAVVDGNRAPSAITVTSTVLGKVSALNSASTSHSFEMASGSTASSQPPHVHPHLHLQQQQQQQKPSTSTATNQYQTDLRK